MLTPTAIIEKIIHIQNNAAYSEIDTVVSPDFVMDMSGGLVINGPSGLQQYFEMLSLAYSDHYGTIDELFTSQNKIAMRATLRGTHDGPLRDIPPSGNKIEMPYMAIGHIDDGKLTKLSVDLDRLEYMMQLGVIPRPAS